MCLQNNNKNTYIRIYLYTYTYIYIYILYVYRHTYLCLYLYFCYTIYICTTQIRHDSLGRLLPWRSEAGFSSDPSAPKAYLYLDWLLGRENNPHRRLMVQVWAPRRLGLKRRRSSQLRSAHWDSLIFPRKCLGESGVSSHRFSKDLPKFGAFWAFSWSNLLSISFWGSAITSPAGLHLFSQRGTTILSHVHNVRPDNSNFGLSLNPQTEANFAGVPLHQSENSPDFEWSNDPFSKKALQRCEGREGMSWRDQSQDLARPRFLPLSSEVH